MKKFMDKLRHKIVINKTLLVFLLTIIIIGVISGAILSSVLSKNDQIIVTNYLNNFIKQAKINNTIISLQDSLTYNIGFLFIIWILGISMIGSLLILPLIFIKSFILGFSIGSIYINFKIKGLLLILSYILPHQLINILVYLFISSYAIMISYNIFNNIKRKKVIDFKKIMNKYTILLIYASLLLTITSLYEVYIEPLMLKIAINLIK